jgi:1-acyl-sn-glycerol-3-phosphate acyltransferase
LVFVIFRFPGWSAARRDRENRRWSRKLLRILSVRIDVDNLPATFPKPCLLVLNHVSWLDIILVNAAHPAVFIAKSEIARWPLVGTLVTRAGTLYIERGSRRALRRTNQHVSETLLSGSLVACFPEGTTTIGEHVGRFHAGLFQPAIDARAIVVPAILRYLDPEGRRCDAAAYVGDDSLAKSLWMLASTPHLMAKLEYLAPVTSGGRERRELSVEIHAALSSRLKTLESGPARN